MKKRWLSLFVENNIGVLAKISGLFSAKLYNLESLTVGTTCDPTVSRMTIVLQSDDKTFEQIKKQLNKCIEVIKVIDLSDQAYFAKEILFLKIPFSDEKEKQLLAELLPAYPTHIMKEEDDYILLEYLQNEAENDATIDLLKGRYPHLEVVRGGSVAILSGKEEK